MREAFVAAGDTEVFTTTWSPASTTPSAPATATTTTNAEFGPVVLVHGLGGSTINWYLVGQPLADALGRDVVALDLLGFGRTPRDVRGSTIDANTELLLQFVRDTGARVLIGNSMGGSISVRVAARHPELVDALVLVNPALPFVGAAPSARGMRNLTVFALAALPKAGPWIIDTRGRRIGATAVVDASLRATCRDPAAMDESIRAALIEQTEWRQAAGVAGVAYHDAIRSLLRYLTTAMATDITAVQARTLVVHGRDDMLVPLALAHGLSTQRPEWQVETLACGHLPPLEAPEELVDVATRWLAGDAAVNTA
jgi:pimeloyl-ACP methyl ester carboxylesterase